MTLKGEGSKSMNSRGVLVALFFVVFSSAPAPADETIYIPRGSVWKYFRGQEEASSPDPTAWRNPGFNDSAWSSGAAPIGYGDSIQYGIDLSLLSPPMEDNYSCVFFRKEFEVTDPGRVAGFDIHVSYDDGYALWINGIEVHRANVEDPLTFDGFAENQHEAETYEDFPLPSPDSYLVEGTNIIAAQVWNNQISSSDLRFDLELVDPFGPDLTPPAVEALVPAAGATVRQLTQIEVTFSEGVQGVDPSDLLINGSSAQGVAGTGKGPYIFSFEEPDPGPVQVAWADGHGIADLVDPPNPFAGQSWAYTLDPNAPEADLVISEFLAANSQGRLDEDGERSDWIEVLNRGATPVDLGGVSVTDDSDEPGKWVFPSVIIGPGEYLLVFASGKDRRPAGGANLHTNFQLNSDGEYLGLFTAESPRQAYAEFSPQFPQQRADISYGISETGTLGYFDPPTPERANGSAIDFSGIVTEPRISPPRGFYDEPIVVEMLTTMPGAEIYYTIDGREPTPATGTRYQGPFEVEGTAEKASITIRAAAYRSGYLPSRSVASTFIYPEHVLGQPPDPSGFPAGWGGAPAADYAMDPEVVNHAAYRDMVFEGLLAIPTLSIIMDVQHMFGASGIYSNPTGEGVAYERPCSVELIYPSGRDGFQVNCGIRIQGGASRQPNKSPKHSLRLLFKGAYGPSKLNYRFFPDSQVNSFDTITLRANYNNSWIHWDSGQRSRGSLIRDQWARDTQLAMGQLSSHGTYMHVYINGLYWGVYNPVERPSAPFAAAHLGGEREEYDALNSGAVVDGDKNAWNTMEGLAKAGLGTLAQYETIQEYLDVPGLIDYMIFNIYGGNADWPGHNWYAVRRRAPEAQYKFVSWDAERILESPSADNSGVNTASSPALFYSQLRANPEFRLLFGDHLHRHFFNDGAMTPEMVSARWMARATEIDLAVVCESARWGDYRRDVHSSSNGPYEFYLRNTHWIPEQNRLRNTYFPVRSTNVLNRFESIGLYPSLGAPVFHQHGGTIDPGFALTMQLPSGTTGTIYYTRDGSDPRTYGSGDISETALSYTGPVVLHDSTLVRARTLNGGSWSALNEAVFSVLPPTEAIRITEIMYNPLGGSGYEFLEIQNVAAYAVDLTGLEFTNGIGFAFAPGAILAPGEYIVLVAEVSGFQERYPNVPIGGIYTGRLENGGEKVTLQDASGTTVISVDYDDEGFWPIGADGFGYSLIELNPHGDPDDPLNWRASAQVNGSPGAGDPAAPHGGIVINEILTHVNLPLEDAVELQNITNSKVDVGGWFLSDDRTDPGSLRKFRIPPGSMIPPGGFLVLYEYQFNPDPGTPPGFELDGMGGRIYLSSADPDGNLTGYIVGHRFDAAEEGVSFGCFVTSTAVDFTALTARSFGVDHPATVGEFRTGGGLSNSPPQVGPVVINEIQFHPPLGEEEFLELHNLQVVPLELSGWLLSGVRGIEGVGDYEMPQGTAIPPEGYLVVVGSDPASFRDRYGVPASAPIVGPYNGILDNGGENLRLLRPSGEPGKYIVVDRVRYNDQDPWPLPPDGEGPSLERIRASDYGNEVLNWEASLEAPGTPGYRNSVSEPGVNQRPVASFVMVPQEMPLVVFLDGSQSEDPDGQIIRYDWDLGDGISGQGKTLTHTYSSAGTYIVKLTVEDNAGATSSATRSVTLVDPGGDGGQLPGDSNMDGRLDLSDVVRFVFHLFLGTAETLPCDGSLFEGGNKTLLDIDQDGSLDVTDAIYTLSYLFQGGPEPVLGTKCTQIPGCSDVCVP